MTTSLTYVFKRTLIFSIQLDSTNYPDTQSFQFCVNSPSSASNDQLYTVLIKVTQLLHDIHTSIAIEQEYNSHININCITYCEESLQLWASIQRHTADWQTTDIHPVIGLPWDRKARNDRLKEYNILQHLEVLCYYIGKKRPLMPKYSTRSKYWLYTE